VTERWIPGANIRKDFLGVIDIIAFKPFKGGVLGVQTTDYTSVSKHVTKAKNSPNLLPWLSNHRDFVIHGWKKDDPSMTPIEKRISAVATNREKIARVAIFRLAQD